MVGSVWWLTRRNDVEETSGVVESVWWLIGD